MFLRGAVTSVRSAERYEKGVNWRNCEFTPIQAEGGARIFPFTAFTVALT